MNTKTIYYVLAVIVIAVLGYYFINNTNTNYKSYQSSKYSNFSFEYPDSVEPSLSTSSLPKNVLEMVYMVEPGVGTYPGGPPIFVALRDSKNIDDVINDMINDSNDLVVSNTEEGKTSTGNMYKAVTMTLDDYSNVSYFVESLNGSIVTIFPNEGFNKEAIFKNAVKVILNSII